MKITLKQYKGFTDTERLKHLEGTGISLSEHNHFRGDESLAIPVEEVVKAINEKQELEDTTRPMIFESQIAEAG